MRAARVCWAREVRGWKGVVEGGAVRKVGKGRGVDCVLLSLLTGAVGLLRVVVVVISLLPVFGKDTSGETGGSGEIGSRCWEGRFAKADGRLRETDCSTRVGVFVEEGGETGR